MSDADVAEPKAPSVGRVVRSYDQLIEVMRARQAELGLTCETIDALAGLPAGYTGKLLGKGQVKWLGPLSFAVLLEALSLELVTAENAAARRHLSPRYRQRTRPQQTGRASPSSIPLQERRFPVMLFQILSARGKPALMRKTTPEWRTERARRAARARWRIAKRAARTKRRKG